MNPITFSCEETLPLAPQEIARQILDLTKWPDFHGFGPLPGIKVAVFEVQTPGIVGSRIRVTNQDGSSHVEEIVEWQPDHRLRLQMKDFSAPLSRLATEFEETWEFQRHRQRNPRYPFLPAPRQVRSGTFAAVGYFILPQKGHCPTPAGDAMNPAGNGSHSPSSCRLG